MLTPIVDQHRAPIVNNYLLAREAYTQALAGLRPLADALTFYDLYRIACQQNDEPAYAFSDVLRGCIAPGYPHRPAGDYHPVDENNIYVAEWVREITRK